MSQFKFTKEERDRIKSFVLDSFDSYVFYLNLIDRIEAIVSERDGWVSVEDNKPEHGQAVLTYTPDSDISEEKFRIIRYGSQLSGFPSGVTHFQITSPPKPKQ